MNELALFAGAGGGILGGHLLGWRTVCAVEWEPYAASVLVARQNDKILPPFPIWDDVQTFDGKPWRGIVDVVSGGFPCQDISAAGKGVGIEGERSGMWGEMARIIHEVRPKFVFVENSPMLTSRGLGRVLGDLATMGFDARWGVLGAANIGANHQRDRIWIVGKTTEPTIYGSSEQTNECIMESQRRSELQFEQSRDTSEMANSRCELRSKRHATELDTEEKIRATSSIYDQSSGERQTNMANASDKRLQGSEWVRDNQEKDGRWIEGTYGSITQHGPTYGRQADWWQSEPDVGRVADGVAARVDRLKAIGNGQVPLCAATAWRILNEL
jgi:DNA (cytosine-5)-methyltransferase 1